MIAMLPLRGWAGEVMATEMASSQVTRAHFQTQKQSESAIELGAARAYIYWSEGTFDNKKVPFLTKNQLFDAQDAKTAAMHDCEGHAKAVEAESADAACDLCSTCQTCHTVALSPTVASFSLAFSPASLPCPAAANFVSAAAALGQKPPIS